MWEVGLRDRKELSEASVVAGIPTSVPAGTQA